MQFCESRGNDGHKPSFVTFTTAMLNPLASFGGLYVPSHLPSLTLSSLVALKDYATLAKTIIQSFDIDLEEHLLDEALALYKTFDNNEALAIKKADTDLYVSELYHGPTRAFKDMALQPFGLILSSIAVQRQEKYLVLAATSGDTGPATLKTFENRPNVKVACLYPEGGTSDVQRLQMVTTDAENLTVIGVKGNFDDTQNALKAMLANPEFHTLLAQKGYKLSAANSVNFGRILFQTIYHIYSYCELIRTGELLEGEILDIIVPSGNFGNALGGYYAKKMGLPLGKIVIASNANNILTQFINEGIYDLRSKELIPTLSPAMDILISSNVERILFDMFGAIRTKELMEELRINKVFILTDEEKNTLQTIFEANYCDDSTTLSIIKEFADKNYILDPHTATGMKAYKERPHAKTLVYSTAEWTKFAPTMAHALLDKKNLCDEDAIDLLQQDFNLVLAPQIASLFNAPIIHSTIVEKEAIAQTIESFI